ncbi:ATP-binding protein [Planomonospora parontospora]|uniref:ATP-binding protein n=1 Tax=Planomonospora parontospora TaxID=58119 RepID=UPI00167173C6|nr:ATP-binding protein [Planomonospora parontospora]GGL43481.1 transcriptional regulator [Planomonospora parontospora subsp. antibiotica]GII18430.1 transcriptional regulator [Planomonospora parontospora subsp. antibiotica]
MTTDLADLLGDRESTVLGFKQSASSRDKIGQAICAFANDLCGRGGGDLLIGVDDKGEPVLNVRTGDEELRRLTDYRDSGQILDRPSMTVETAVFKGGTVIRVHVEASATPPVRYDGVVWVRPGPTTRRATREDERVLAERRRAFDGPFDGRSTPGSTLDDLDMTLFRSTYLPSVVSPEVIEENGRPEALQLASLRMADLTGTPTVLGLLVLGFNPSGFIPGAYLQFVRYDGAGQDAPIADDQELRVNVVDLAGRLDPLLRGHLHTQVVEEEGFRERQRPDYPFAALREACMNAVMHRNYETSYAPIRVLWFADRIEITNPGGPYGQVRPDNFDRVSDFRNPSLAAAMKSLGYVNRFGRGIGRIQASLAGNGNPPAEFLVDDSSWSVTLRRAE